MMRWKRRRASLPFPSRGSSDEAHAPRRRRGTRRHVAGQLQRRRRRRRQPAAPRRDAGRRRDDLRVQQRHGVAAERRCGAQGHADGGDGQRADGALRPHGDRRQQRLRHHLLDQSGRLELQRAVPLRRRGRVRPAPRRDDRQSERRQALRDHAGRQPDDRQPAAPQHLRQLGTGLLVHAGDVDPHADQRGPHVREPVADRGAVRRRAAAQLVLDRPGRPACCTGSRRPAARPTTACCTR